MTYPLHYGGSCALVPKEACVRMFAWALFVEQGIVDDLGICL